jgi:hypothetical protein
LLERDISKNFDFHLRAGVPGDQQSEQALNAGQNCLMLSIGNRETAS